MPSGTFGMRVSGRKPEVLVTHREGETYGRLLGNEALFDTIIAFKTWSIFENVDDMDWNGRAKSPFHPRRPKSN